MTTKVCVSPYRENLKDAITLGKLQDLISGLHGLGFNDDTPVTYLYDDDHVWLETVEEPDVVVVLPRVVQSLGESEKGSEWIDDDGDHWTYTNRWVCHAEDGELYEGLNDADQSCAPYTEVK